MPNSIVPHRTPLSTTARLRLIDAEELRRDLRYLREGLAGVAEDTAEAHPEMDPAELAEVISSTADYLAAELESAEAEMRRRVRLRSRGCPIAGDTFPPAFLADLKVRVAVDDLVETELGATLGRPNRAGVRRGACPIHGCGGQSHSDPFAVYPAKGKWRCFSCGERGDAVAAVQIGRGLSFVQAVIALADRAGLPLPEGVRRGE